MSVKALRDDACGARHPSGPLGRTHARSTATEFKGGSYRALDRRTDHLPCDRPVEDGCTPVFLVEHPWAAVRCPGQDPPLVLALFQGVWTGNAPKAGLARPGDSVSNGR